MESDTVRKEDFMSQQWITVRLKREQAQAISEAVECAHFDELNEYEWLHVIHGAKRIKESLDRHPVKEERSS